MTKTASRPSSASAGIYRHGPGHSKTCLNCGFTFHAIRKDAKTCSPKCRQALSRAIKPQLVEFFAKSGKGAGNGQ